MTTAPTEEDLRRIYRRILGESPGAPDETRRILDERAGRLLVAQSLKVLHDHTDPVVLITGLVAGLAFLCDEYKFDRPTVADELAKFALTSTLEIVPR